MQHYMEARFMIRFLYTREHSSLPTARLPRLDVAPPALPPYFLYCCGYCYMIYRACFSRNLNGIRLAFCLTH